MAWYSRYDAGVRARKLSIHSQFFYYGEVLEDGYLRVDADGKIYLSAGGGLLPDQTGQNGKVLFTNGTDPYWGSLTGGGDMPKAVYDTNDDGIVDVAAAIAGTPGNSKVYTTSGAGAQQWESQATGFNKAIGTTAGTISAGDHTHSVYLLIADIDDTPVDGVTTAPISSNWAYDHMAANNPHGVDAADIAAAVPTGKFLRDDGTWQTAITSLTGYLQSSIYDANTILKADADNTPLALTIAEQTLIGRITGGSITALTPTQVRTLLNVADGAEVNVNADWNASSGDAQILNKPTLGGAAALNVGTTTGTVAAGDHNHSGVYEPALGFTPENASNKETSALDTSTTKYPCNNVVKTAVDAVSQASFYAGTMTVNYGTLDTGVVTDLQAVGGTDVNISEATGANPLQVTFDFTGITRLNSFVFYGRYSGGAAHQVYVEIYNTGTTNWDLLAIIGHSDAKIWHGIPIYNTTAYINAGAVSVRFRHIGTGINTHDLILDYVELNYGGAGGQTNLTASEILFVAGGNISATNVYSAIAELDSEKTAKDGSISFTGIVSYGSHPTFTTDTQIVDKKYVDDAITAGGGYTDEMAQDTVGGILTDSASIDFTYDDVTPSITAIIKDSSITEGKLSFSDVTTANVSALAHGLCPKIPNNTTTFLRGDGTFATPTASAAWGSITGTLSDQTDLNSALGDKAPTASPTFSTSITGSYLTASEMLITDGSKNIVSAPVATYPSLTELSYVKGLTSAVQVQINGKAASNHTHTYRIPHTVAVQGEIKVPSGGTDYLPGFFVDLPSGQSATLSAARYKIYSGTSATVKIQVNGSDATGFTSISVGTTAALTEPAAVTVSDGDYITLVVTAVSGTPTHLSFTMFLDYTK